ncbi:hypothetical protein KKE33_01625, partial [Patescibacteria group bacterium]|nr:hypothetical protein [Patescibacteria group bacterium]
MFKPKLIIGFLVVILLVGVAAYSLFILGVEEKTKAVHGHSVKDTEIEAVAEAVSMIKRGVSDPDYVLLFSTAGYDSETVLKEVNRLLPHSKIYGSTSMLSVITKDG